MKFLAGMNELTLASELISAGESAHLTNKVN